MPRIVVCSLALAPMIVERTGARTMVTLINPDFPVDRPPQIAADRHLRLSVADIDAAMDGHIAPAETHVRAIIDFARGWDRVHPMLIHCYAGVSRSTAAALIAYCALKPDCDTLALAHDLRRKSPTATPNKLLISHGDAMLGRGGALIAAVDAIGRGEECYEGQPFALNL